jgi:hypothetical protein
VDLQHIQARVAGPQNIATTPVHLGQASLGEPAGDTRQRRAAIPPPGSFSPGFAGVVAQSGDLAQLSCQQQGIQPFCRLTVLELPGCPEGGVCKTPGWSLCRGACANLHQAGMLEAHVMALPPI